MSKEIEPEPGTICIGLTKYVVKCFGCNELIGTFAATKKDAIKQIRGCGWRTHGDMWHCPVCYW